MTRTVYIVSEAAAAADFAAARALFEEYAAQLKIDLCFQGFAAELDQLAQIYAPPTGCLLLARRGDVPVGCGAIRRLSGQSCEMKRLYIQPADRGAKLGRVIAQAVAGEGSCARLRERAVGHPGRDDPRPSLVPFSGFSRDRAVLRQPVAAGGLHGARPANPLRGGDRATNGRPRLLARFLAENLRRRPSQDLGDARLLRG